MADQVIYLLLLAVFVALMWGFLRQQQSGAVVWEDYYVKEIAQAVNAAEPGDVLRLDVHTATEVAQKNHVPDLQQIFFFDQETQEVCGQFSLGDRTCFAYVNDVKVAWRIDLGARSGKNVLVLEVGV